MKSPQEIIRRLEDRNEVQQANTLEDDSTRIVVEFRKDSHTYKTINQMAHEHWRVEATSLGGDKIIFTTNSPNPNLTDDAPV